MRGAITLERGLRAGTKLRLAGWTRQAGGEPEFVSLSAEVAARGGPRKTRSRRRHDNFEPEGRFSSAGERTR
jgi:hypothetical protein